MNTNYYCTNKPQSARINDLWFKFEKDNKVTLYEYKNNQWQPSF
jgi:hypothetical protein